MSHKRVLIISKAFYPEITPRSFRATELAKEFSKQGHDVTVLIDDKGFDYSDFSAEHTVRIKHYGKLRCKPLKASRIRIIGDLKRKFGRLLFMLFDYPNIEISWRLKAALKKESGYDLAISIAVPYPIHWGMAWARTAGHRIAETWVADCGDPFMGNTLESFRYPFYFKYIEKWFSRKADYISIPTAGAMGSYYKEFHPKIKIIPQGFDLSDISLYKGNNPSERIQFAYAGGVSASGVRSPIKLIQYLISQKQDFTFVVFATQGASYLRELAANAEGRIEVRDPLPRKQLLYELSKMDFLVNLDNGTLHQMPSKLIDYSLTGRPILNIYGENPDFKLVEQFLKRDYSGALTIENIDQYKIENVVKQFLNL